MTSPPLVWVSNHLFSPEKLAAAVADAEREHPGKSSVLKGTVDAKGVNVVLALGAQDGRYKVAAAFSKDWAGSVAFGASGAIAW